LETASFALIFSRLTLVLGGVLAPLEIFPEPLRSIAQALPFSTILYGESWTQYSALGEVQGTFQNLIPFPSIK
jgi:ABC-type uncharacterized transport system permease subunit